MRVLVVDDDPDSRTIFRAALEFAGHQVLEAGSGSEVPRLAREQALDAVLMDMELPGMNGWETTRALGADPATAGIPVIGVSAHALPEHVERGREAGCAGYLTKPVEPSAMVQEVERIVRARRAA